MRINTAGTLTTLVVGMTVAVVLLGFPGDAANHEFHPANVAAIETGTKV